jgi:hypothetical protein
MDIERIRYALSRYLRTRLLKIERNLEHILANIDTTDRLSVHEKNFAAKLNTLNNTYFEDTVSSKMHEDGKEYFEACDDRHQNAIPQLQVYYLNNLNIYSISCLF